jgi:hypothetical protein
VKRPGAAHVLGAALVGLLGATLLVELPRRSGQRFWSDGATYHAMAGSLAHDFDLRYEVRDLERTKEEYPGGPTGLFLKKSRGALYFAKALVYPLVGAPLVRVLGGTRGLLALNGLSFSLGVWLAYGELRRRGIGEWSSLLVVLGLFVSCVGPLYVWWLTPEVFNFALVTAGLVLWSRGRSGWSAVLLGVAVYSKPTNVFLAGPLLLEPLLTSWGRGLIESVKRGAMLSVATLALFGLNWALTGELNYQGGERKTFYSKFPYETAETTFETGGIWMSTEHVGPLVAEEDQGKETVKTGPARSAEELRASFVRNLGYFWVGRFGGVAPYFPAMALGVLLFVGMGGRSAAGWLCLLSLLSSYVFFIWLIPDNWYGGGGTVGNRYFLNLLPLGLFVLPRGREWVVGVLGGALGLWLLAPVLASPIEHSLHPGKHATARTFRFFPAELTMLNDLSIFTDVWRKKRPYGDYDLYFLDDGTFGQESSFGMDGFWLRGGGDAEVVLAASRPVERLLVGVTAGPRGDIVTVRIGGDRRRVTVAGLKTEGLGFEPGPGFPYYGRALYRLQLNSRFAGSSAGDPRPLGAFVTIAVRRPVGRPAASLR